MAGHFNQWLESKEADSSESTMVRYTQVAEDFLSHLGERAKRPITTLATPEMQSFLTSRRQAGCGPTTVQLDGKILRAVLNQARRIGLIDTNPAEALELPKRQSVQREVFSPKEVRALVETAHGEWKTVILLGYYTGARLSDCCKIEWAELDMADATAGYKQKKTGDSVVSPLHTELHSHLKELVQPGKPQKFIVPGMAELGPGGRHGLSEGFKRIVLKAGLDLKITQGAGKRKIAKRTFHALRHSFTSALANAGVPAELRMKLTGHRSEAVHQGYTHHELQTLRDAISKLASLGIGTEPQAADSPGPST